jgi:hypothetical protein
MGPSLVNLVIILAVWVRTFFEMQTSNGARPLFGTANFQYSSSDNEFVQFDGRFVASWPRSAVGALSVNVARH